MAQEGNDNASLIRSLPLRDRLAIIGMLGVVTVLSWVYLVDMARNMDEMMASGSMQQMASQDDMKLSEMESSDTPVTEAEMAGMNSADMKGEMAMGGEGNDGSMESGEVAIEGMGDMNDMRDMSDMSDMGDMEMGGGMMMQDWTMKYFVAMFLMWAIMMVAMMVPTAVPMALIYAAIARKAASQGTTIAPTATFVTGYIVMWCVFSFFATVAQWGLDEAALLSPMMVSSSPAVGAALLIGAGIYQMTPMKNACLQHCRAPAHFISKSWQPGVMGAFRMGIKHGAYCLGCCWILMGLLFFGGVMSLLWIAGITLFVLLEKVIPFGTMGGKLAGGGLVVWGLVSLGLWQFAS